MAPTLLERTIDRLQNEPVNADAKKPDAGLTVGRFLLEQLSAWGVERIYGVLGDANLFFLDDIAKHGKIQYVPFLDENAAALAAAAEAKLTGRVGVVLGTCGPGLTNMMNGLADAYADHAGVLAITGQVDEAKIGTSAKQYLQQQLTVAPFAAFSELLAHPDALPEMLQRCLTLSSVRGAVTHLSVPKKMFLEPVKGAPLPYTAHLHQPLLAPAEDVEATFRLIAEAERPMLLLGRGVEGVERETLALAEALGAAVATTLPAKHVFPNGHNLFVGGFGLAGSEAASVAMAESDLVVVCGATWWPDEYTPPTARVVQIDAIRENIGIGHGIVRGLVGDLADIMPRFAGFAKTLARDEKRMAAWQRRVTDLRMDWMKRLEAEADQTGTPMTPPRIMKLLSEAIPPEAIVALDTGDHSLWWGRAFENRGQRLLVSGTLRTLGFALPAAIAAGLASSGRPIVAVAGDGGVQQTLIEFKTAAKLGLPIALVVLNNGSYAIEYNRMRLAGLDASQAKLDNPDFSAIATACGGFGMRADDEAAFRAALATAFDPTRVGTPLLIDVATEPTVLPHTKL
ncbi:thiamine pyrophosphate-binding protein [Paenibacillus antri]|uniref:Thiamine pyrophosphate-binding protein n=1 Tax=Paenibacillus antri TaxID=2582848 RepID=A0A5R9GIV6_9BACL|nr:thiamine pyrophosphate-binding protein [Paenibacillus antri]TLS54270.1 thiamine pyrophosphate-binding protein [Paenibacillus antri]